MANNDSKTKKKIKKTCDNCALLFHNLCATPGTKCDNWVNKKRTCIDCEFANSCILLGKNDPSCFGFCSSFKKKKEKNPISMFHDSKEYEEHKKEKLLKKEKLKKEKKEKLLDKKEPEKKKLEKKLEKQIKTPLLDTEIDTPIKAPLIKVARKRKELDPSLQDKDRSEWSPLDKIEEIVSRNYDPDAFALVDERDLPKSDNIIKFILEPQFLNQPLYPRQLQICLDFFQAFCPVCSDTDWIRNKIKVDEKIENILDRTVLYSNGVCPKCGQTRYEAVKNGTHTNYTTLNLAVGQRCITADSRVLCADGIIKIAKIAEDREPGTYDYKKYVGLENGRIAKTSKFFVFAPSTVNLLSLTNGFYIVGTPDHPVKTEKRYMTLSEIENTKDKESIWIPIFYGQNIFGKRTPALDFIKLDNYTFVTDNILAGTKEIQCAYLKHVFDTKSHFDNDTRSLVLSLRFKTLAYDISAMLSNIGIIHRITTSWTTTSLIIGESIQNVKFYNIEIKGHALRNFQQEIGFEDKDKNDQLDQLISFASNTRKSFWYEKLPPSYQKWIENFTEAIKVYVDDKFQFYINREITKRTFIIFNEKTEQLRSKLPEHLQKIWNSVYDGIINNNIYWVQVKTCKRVGKKQKTYDFEVPNFASFMANGILNHNSGKTSLIWMISPAIIHEYLQIPNPAKFMRQLDVTEFHATFVGVTAEDAYKNVWSPMDNVFTWSPWYNMYHQFLDSEGKRIGIELYKHLGTFIAYFHKGINAYSSAPDFRRIRGKCVTGDTFITTGKGTFLAKNLYKLRKLPTVRMMLNDNRIVAIEKQKKKKEVVRITFSGKHKLKLSYDHRVPTFDESTYNIVLHKAKNLLGKWCIKQLGAKFPKKYIFNVNPYLEKELNITVTARVIADGKTAESFYRINKKFKVEDWIQSKHRGSITLRKNKIRIPTELTPELARIIGYLVADGSIASEQTIGYDTTSREKLDDFVSLVKKVFGFTPRHSKKRDSYYTSGWYCRCEISYKKIIHFFKEIGFHGQKAYTKKLPDCIMQGPRNCVVECLSAMISSDGGFTKAGSSCGYSLFYSSKSKKLLEQVHILFGNLGYYSRLCSRGVTMPRYETSLFLKEYTGLRKYTFREDNSVEVTKGHRSFYMYLIPGTHYYVRSEINKMFGITHIPKKLRKFIDANITFCKVEKVKSIGKKVVYDIEIDSDDHLFPANNILVHNTRLCGGIDEGAYLTGDKIMMNAWQVYDALNNSLSTIQTAHEKIFQRFPWAPNAYGLYTSSTRSKQDFIMGMHKRAKRNPSIYSRRLATWQFNPNMPKDCAFIKSKYIEDYVAAERDYASNPPFASDPFIQKAAQIVPCLSNRNNVLHLDIIKITKDSLGGKALYPTIKCKPHTYPCVLSIDAGYKKNSFALALSHRLPMKDDPESYLLATSGLLEIAPREGIPISYAKVYENVIVPILEKFNVKLFATDQWQGLDLQSRVYNDFGIDALQYSVKYDDFELLRRNINSETWELPKLDGELKDILDMEKDFDELIFRKPVSHLMLQLLLSKDTGKSVVKNTDAGEDFTDDLLRASVLGISLLEDEEYAYLFEEAGSFVYKGPVGAIASFGGNRGTTSIPGIGALATFK